MAAKTVAAAVSAAEATGQPVVVSSSLTPEMAQWVLPDGSRQWEIAAGPVRVRDGAASSGWSPVDLTLQNAFGVLRPGRPFVRQAFSPGGVDAPAAVLGAGDDKQVELGSEQSLPVPRALGSTVTYANVLPNVDMSFTSGVTGFEQKWVLQKAPPAGKALVLRVPINSGILVPKIDAGGSLALFDGRGVAVAGMSAPVMFDSSIDPLSKQAATGVVKARLVGSGASTVLEITPDAAWLANAVYPVTIDPFWSFNSYRDTYVDQDAPTTNFSTSTLLKAQQTAASASRQRTLGIFYLQGLPGGLAFWKTAQVLYAQLKFYQEVGSGCLATGDLQIKNVAQEYWTSYTVTWNNVQAGHPPGGNTYGDVSNVPCTAGWLYFGDNGATQNINPGANGNIRNLVGWWLTNPSNLYYQGVPDGNTGYFITTTGSAAASKQFRSSEFGNLVPTLSVTLDHPPTSPTGPQMPSPGSAQASRTLSLGSTFNDPDGGANDSGCVRYTIRNSANAVVAGSGGSGACGTAGNLDGHGTATGNPVQVAPGLQSVASLTVPADDTYKIEAQSIDGDNLGSGITTWYVTVASSPPAAPTGLASPNTFPSPNVWYSTASTASFQWNASAGATGYYVVVDRTPTTAASAANGVLVTATSATATPPTGTGYLHVAAKNAAGVLSPTATFAFHNDLGGANASDDIGPGAVDLVTGNYAISETDASESGATSTMTVSRTYNSRAAGGDAGSPFGQGWTASFPSDDAPSDYAALTDGTTSPGGKVTITTTDGDTLSFSGPSHATGTVTYTADDPESTELSVAWTTGSGGSNTFVLTDTTTGEKTEFATANANGVYTPSAFIQPTSSGKAAVTLRAALHGAAGSVWKVDAIGIAAASLGSGVDCSGTAAIDGCRQLRLLYAVSTTASGPAGKGCDLSQGVVPGDFLNQVSKIELWVASGGSWGVNPVGTLAQYAYDVDGRLCAEWDPRISPALKTQYVYDTNFRITKLTPPGENPWTLAYTAAPGEDPSVGRLATVSRAAVAPATGNAVKSIIYNVPVNQTDTSAADPINPGNGPWNLSASNTARWAQTSDLPVTATAVFPATQLPVATQGYAKATLHYIDAAGYETNTADPAPPSPGEGYITTSEYDAFGNVLRSLSAANRLRALASATPPATAATLRTESSYSSDGIDLKETLGPQHQIKLDDGSVVQARVHVVNSYDAQTDGSGNLLHPHFLITTDEGAQVVGQSGDRDVRRTVYDYTGQSGLGWTRHAPTSVTVDPADQDGGLNLTTTTLYDATSGLVTESRMPANPAGGDAHATKTVYYKPGATSGDASCDNQPLVADLVCKTLPVAQPGTVGLPDLPSTLTIYDAYQNPKTITDTVGGSVPATRQTVLAYDTAERPTLTTTTATGTGAGAAVQSQATTYDGSTGRATLTQSKNGSTVTATITRHFDALGRLDSYTDADGQASTTTFDIADRPLSVADGKGSTTYTYDETIDRRGLLTSQSDTAISGASWAAAYDADGALVDETMPNALHRCLAYDETGDATSQTYVRGSCASPTATWVAETQTSSVHGQWQSRASTFAAPFTTNTNNQDYAYDAAGRMAQTKDTYNAACTTRIYGFDYDTNRTSVVTRNAGVGGACTTTGGTTKNWTYDAADRITTSGYAYDPFGRITSVPAADNGSAAIVTAGYYTTDLVNTLAKAGGATRTWTLDPNQRLRAWSDSADGQTRTNHFIEDSDSPSWTSENAAGTTWTRAIEGISGDLGALQTGTGVTLKLTNLHGDVFADASTSTTATAPTSVYQSTEFGLPRSGGTGSARYQWLGGKERQTDTLTGIDLMGVRLYIPQVGRFLQVDPVPGGSANDYDYCSGDPVNCTDLAGTMRDYAAGGGPAPRGGGIRGFAARVRNMFRNSSTSSARNQIGIEAHTAGAYRGSGPAEHPRRRFNRASYKTGGRSFIVHDRTPSRVQRIVKRFRNAYNAAGARVGGRSGHVSNEDYLAILRDAGAHSGKIGTDSLYSAVRIWMAKRIYRDRR